MDFHPIYFEVLFSPILYLSLLLLVVTHIWGHKAGSSPLSTISTLPARLYYPTYVPLSREDFSSFLPRRLAPNCSFARYALSALDRSFFFLQINSKSRHDGIRTHGPALRSSIRGLPPVQRGNRLLIINIPTISIISSIRGLPL